MPPVVGSAARLARDQPSSAAVRQASGSIDGAGAGAGSATGGAGGGVAAAGGVDGTSGGLYAGGMVSPDAWAPGVRVGSFGRAGSAGAPPPAVPARAARRTWAG